MDISKYLERLEQIIAELEMRKEFLDMFRDRRPGYIEGYANALSEMMLKIRAIKVLIEKIEEKTMKYKYRVWDGHQVDYTAWLTDSEVF